MDRAEPRRRSAAGASAPVRVLHLDDSSIDAELVHARIAADDGGAWSFVHVSGREEFEAAVSREAFDLILTDYSIPGYDGLAAVQYAHRLQPQVPIIVISGTVSEEEAVAAVRAGATDYVFKQRLQRLAPAARRALAEAQERQRRREAEASVKQLAEGFGQLAARSADIFWMISLRPERVVFVSPSVERTWGRPVDAFYADVRAWAKAIHPEDRGRVEAGYDAWLRGEAAAFDQEFRVVRPDGSVRWVHDSGTQLADASGSVEYISGIARDITEWREAHHRIVESEKRFRATFEQAAVGMSFRDFEGRCLRVNDRFCQIVGFPEAELMAGALPLHPDDAGAAGARRRQLAAGEVSTNRGLERYLRKDGSVVWCDSTRSVVRDETGRPEYIVLVIQDVTDRVRAEREIAELNASLERKVEERTRALATANRELEAFSYSVSHDLRAPLHAIAGFAGALRDDCMDKLDPRGRHFVERIRAGADRMDALIEDLLSLGRISRAELLTGEVDLEAMARDIVGELAERAPQRRYRLAVMPGLRARGDAGLLRVALTNLLGNAWKFSAGREEAVIEVGRLAQHEGGEDVFYVRDNGAGFDPAHAGKLFGAFQRLHSQSEFPGSGIGLATVRRVIDRHGGQVWAEGRPGEGATFYVSLPADPSGARDAARRQATS